MTKDIEINILELKKLEEQLKIEHIHSEKEKKLLTWLKFLTNPDSMEDSDMKDVREVKMAKEELDKLRQNEREERLAELREKHIMDSHAIEKYGYNNGYNIGLEEGRKEIAKKLLNKNISIKEIIEITGLTKEELENI